MIVGWREGMSSTSLFGPDAKFPLLGAQKFFRICCILSAGWLFLWSTTVLVICLGDNVLSSCTSIFREILLVSFRIRFFELPKSAAIEPFLPPRAHLGRATLLQSRCSTFCPSFLNFSGLLHPLSLECH